MPVTPFHFGPGLLAKGLAPRRFSFLLFAATQIAIDLESGTFLWRDEWPFHRVMHSFAGAAAVCAATLLVVRAAGAFLLRRWTFPALVRQDLEVPPGAAAVTAAAGVVGHVVPDAIMHADVTPFLPLGAENPLLDAIPLGALHGVLAAAGCVGAALWCWRARRSRP
jgi:hypothetical protein